MAIETVRPENGRNGFLPLATLNDMATRKLSISVPPEVEEMIKAAAAEEGVPVSAWLAEAAIAKAGAAAKHAAGLAAANEMVEEYERENGPIPEEHWERAREFMREAGILRDDELRTAG
jgi:uncharacterized protein (DUF1778 family)